MANLTPRDINRILGEKRFVSAKDAASVYKISTSEVSNVKLPHVSFGKILEQFAIENERDGRDWRFVYFFGFSIRMLVSKVTKIRPELPSAKSSFFLEQPSSDCWALSVPLKGYKLIDFSGRCGGCKWEDQEIWRRSATPPFYRAEIAHVAKALVTFRDLHEEYLLSMWDHWGSSYDSLWNKVFIGHYTPSGFEIDACGEDEEDEDLRVCVTLPTPD